MVVAEVLTTWVKDEAYGLVARVGVDHKDLMGCRDVTGQHVDDVKPGVPYVVRVEVAAAALAAIEADKNCCVLWHTGDDNEKPDRPAPRQKRALLRKFCIDHGLIGPDVSKSLGAPGRQRAEIARGLKVAMRAGRGDRQPEWEGSGRSRHAAVEGSHEA